MGRMNAMTAINQTASSAPTAMKALTIRLQDEVFAVAAQSVREILDLVPITEVPNAPPFVGGLINVRGRVVPLADLRVMFGMDRPKPDADTRIVVMEIDIEGEPAIVGILADKVHDVTDIESASIEDAPRVGMRWKPEFIAGIGKRNGQFIIIPDMAKIFETQSARKAHNNSEERSQS
jgi:purine-binding chemotaxis protein CheW